MRGGRDHCGLSCALWSRTERSDDGCINWTGALNGRGYGQLCYGMRHWTAHHAAYAVVHGHEAPVHRRRYLHHTCRNKRCCNPDHLELVTAKEHRREHMS